MHLRNQLNRNFRPLCLSLIYASVFLAGSARAANFYPGVTNSLPWPGGLIPYQFDTNVTAAQQTVYLAGMKEWELAANVHFIARSNQSQYVILRFDYQQGTNTYVASVPPVMTVDTLSRSQVGHETGHLLGFQHEHVRLDRDGFIAVNSSNLQTNGTGEQNAGVASLYLIDSNSVANGAYDFESVMHYGRTLFSIDPDHLDVLVPKPAYLAKYYYRIGNLALSVGDRAGAAFLYGPPTTPLTNVVTTTADFGFGSLRAAMYYANDHPGTTVRFNIPTSDPGFSNGVYTIYLTGELSPIVTDGTVIDAQTQPGFTSSPIISLNGSRLIPEIAYANFFYSSAFHLYASNCTVRGFALNHFPGTSILVQYPLAQSNHIEGCYVGLSPWGTNADGCTHEGISVDTGASRNIIGGTNASQRNVISGNSSYGLLILGTNTIGNIVQGNYIGLNAAGSTAIANGVSGIGIWNGSSSNVIGRAVSGGGNVISGNTEYGVFVGDSNTVGTVFQGNYIGTDAAGNFAISNRLGGIAIFNDAHQVTIGGTSALARNILSGNGGSGVMLQGSGVTNNVLQGNYFGLNASGTSAVPNVLAGLYVVGGSSSNLIGGTVAGAGNVLSGNSTVGLYIRDPGTRGNVVQGNIIGLNAAGTAAITNSSDGIYLVNGTSNNVIGGTVSGSSNIISGNSGTGIFVSDPGTMNNVVQGNLIGTGPQGTNALPNGSDGIGVWGGAANNLIGGTNASARNLISGNNGQGIAMGGVGTSGNVIWGNYVGAASNGTTALPNGGIGVYLVGGASSNLIGGTLPGAGNVISANRGDGIQFFGAGTSSNLVQGNLVGTTRTGASPLGNNGSGLSLILGPRFNLIGGTNGAARNTFAASTNGDGVYIYAASNNIVQGNYIGTDSSGSLAFSNGAEGLTLFAASVGNQIGGSAVGAGNVIGASRFRGVFIADPGTSGNVIQGNHLGVGTNGAAPLGNGFAAVVIQNGASNNVIGLDASGGGAGNVIAYSGFEGLAIFDSGTVGNTVHGNTFFNNGGLGINLAGGTEDGFGVTANHPGGPVTGPNNLQNFPLITSVSAYPNASVVRGSLNGSPSRIYAIDVYWNTNSDPSGHGEAQVYAGSTGLTTDSSGNGDFAFNATSNLLGRLFTASATDLITGDTSEFSGNVAATNGPPQFIGSLTRGTNGFSMSIFLQTNLSYHIQGSTNLATNPVAWVNLTNFTASNSPFQFTDRTATNIPVRFYRVSLP